MGTFYLCLSNIRPCLWTDAFIQGSYTCEVSLIWYFVARCQILFWFVVVAIQKKTLKIIFYTFKSVTTLNFKSINFVGYEDQADLRKNVTLMFENVQLCEKEDIKGRGDN